MNGDLNPLPVLATLCLATLVACSQAPHGPVPVAFTPCRLAGVGPVDSSWRQVRGSGFTFCIPGAWRASKPAADSLDPKSWRGPEGSVTWGTGRPASLLSAGADNGGERDRCHGSRGPTAKSRHPDGNHGKALVSVPDHHPHRDRQCGPYRHAGVMSRDVEDHCLEYGASNVRSRRGTFVRAGAAVECNHGDNSVRVGAMTEPA